MTTKIHDVGKVYYRRRPFEMLVVVQAKRIVDRSVNYYLSVLVFAIHGSRDVED